MNYIRNAPVNKQDKKILSLIPEGKENAITMRHLSYTLNVSKRAIRQMIVNARVNGAIIAGDSNGYYIPADQEELNDYFRIAEARIRTASIALHPVRKMLREDQSENS